VIPNDSLVVSATITPWVGSEISSFVVMVEIIANNLLINASTETAKTLTVPPKKPALSRCSFAKIELTANETAKLLKQEATNPSGTLAILLLIKPCKTPAQLEYKFIIDLI